MAVKKGNKWTGSGILLAVIAAFPALTMASVDDGYCDESGRDIEVKVCAPRLDAKIPDLLPQDSIHGQYVPGVGYYLRATENVGLRIFRERVIDEVNEKRAADKKILVQIAAPNSEGLMRAFSQVPEEEVLRAAIKVMQKAAGSDETVNAANASGSGNAKEEMVVSVATPAVVISGLAGLDSVLNELINRANSTASSALLSLRSHIAASQADLNVIFRNRMNETFDKLSASQQQILTAAQILAANAESTIQKVEKDGYEHASDLVCQTTVGFANYSLGLPIGRFLPPDLVCMKQAEIRDVGPNHEQLLIFRGVHLQPKEEYPAARISVAGSEIRTITGGGNDILQVPLPGGVNGAPNDLSSRGDRVAQVEFTWQKSSRTRRWLFELKPYLVSSLNATMTPTLKGPVRKLKTQTCYLKAEGGHWSAREEYATCTILADEGWEIESCVDSSPTTARGNAGIRNKLYSAGACQWEMKAKSESRYGKGSWYGFEGRATMKKIVEIAGKPHLERKILNQTDKGTSFVYPKEYVPQEYEILPAKWSWQIDYFDNQDQKLIFTDSQPTVTGKGAGSMSNGVLTWNKLP